MDAFSVTLETVGTETITATDLGNTSVKGIAIVQVAPSSWMHVYPAAHGSFRVCQTEVPAMFIVSPKRRAKLAAARAKS